MLHRLNRAGWPMAATLAIAATGVATPAAAPAQSAAAATRIVEVDTDQGRLVTLSRPISDVFVANPAVADVQVRSPTQIYVFGKSPGQTTVSATTKTGQVVFAATIRVGNNFGSINQMLRLAMPEAQVASYTLNGVVLLTGTVLSPADAEEAQSLVQAFVGDKVKVISRLKTATPLQVNLQVKFAEVSKTFAKNIGANLTTLDGSGGFQFGVGTGRTITSQFNALGGPLGIGSTAATCVPPISPTGQCASTIPGTAITPGTQNTTLAGMGKLFGLDILGALDLGETDGQVVTLAQPNLSALSGETASFLAGGEIPIPISQGLGAVSVEYKTYGVSLAYTPTVLSDGRISLRVRPEVSQLSTAGAVTIGGVSIPALTTRRAETTVELGSGQSMVIGGLIQNSTQNQIDKAPGLGDVPILGALFRSTGWKRNETELMIVITPYLVKPINANEVVLPTDGYQAPTDLGRVFLGKLGGGVSGGERAKPTMAVPNAAGPSVGLNAPVPVAPATPMPNPDTKRDEKAVLPKKTKKAAGSPAPGFSL
ncbi:type II and III secretion system protein family protein [Sphingomonas sp.]|jgi:pilus assembly protein CpaC|uniref:type II and III secretion system protein family protein n=1 Tax=Sphingomonas sp. TaxID=28214 RepID=UPI002E37CEBF|nr:type II and III secretion system protein family protein [Sphingomonas sp.]HEX4693009.1 type II and III secretion system protein family protein [Sphingomonas sp.]